MDFPDGSRVVCVREGSRFYGAHGIVQWEMPSGMLLVDFNDTPTSISPESLRIESPEETSHA